MKFDQLRDWYRSTITEKIADLNEAKAALAGGDDTAAISIRMLAHKLRGTGSSYGFPQITDAAGALEDCEESELVPLLDALIDTLGAVAKP